jgi:hypothetical protein
MQGLSNCSSDIMHTGDRVRLKPGVAKNFTKRSHAFDWTTRVGEIVRIARVTRVATIQWSDRKSLDHWPLQALTRVK